MRMLLLFTLTIAALAAEEKKLTDAEARAYLSKKNAAAEAENAVLMRYAQFKQQQEEQQKAFEADMVWLQKGARTVSGELAALVESLRAAAKCDKCALDADLRWIQK